MADKKLKFRIQGVDEVSPKMKGVEKNAKSMGNNVSNSSSKVSKSFLAIGAAAGVAAIASLKMAGDFEKGMGNVATLVDTGVESMDTMKKEVLEISKRTPVALGDLTESLYNVRSAGIAAEDAMTVLEKSAQLGITGLGSTAEAVDLATSAMNAFNLKGEEANEVFDLIQLTVKSGKTTISELAQSFGNVAGVAKTAGVGFKELQAATAAMTTSGQKASVAQNSLRQAILSIQAPTKDMQKLIGKLGFESGQTMIKELGLVESLRKVNEASGGSAEVMKKAFGSVEALGAALSLAGEQADEFDSIMLGMGDSAGTLDEAFAKQSATFAAQKQILQNNLTAAMIQLGSVVLPILNKAIQAILPVIQSFSTWFTNLSENGLESGTVLSELADIAVNYLLPTIKSVFSAISSAVSTWKEVWADDFAYIKTFTSFVFGSIGTVIKTSLTAVSGLINATAAAMRGDWGEAMKALSDSGQKAMELNEGWIQKLADFISDILMWITEMLSSFTTGFLSAIDSFGIAFTQKWQAIWTGVKTIFTDIWTSILKALENMLNKAIEILNKMIRAINRIPGVNIPMIPSVSLVSTGEEKAAEQGANQARATGGSVLGGSSYLVGERGAEMFVPNQSGTIIPNDKLSGGSNFTFILNGDMDSESRMNKFLNAVEERLSRKMELQRFGATT
jgi:TP901 family phage tail tape measure protein